MAAEAAPVPVPVPATAVPVPAPAAAADFDVRYKKSEYCFQVRYSEQRECVSGDGFDGLILSYRELSP